MRVPRSGPPRPGRARAGGAIPGGTKPRLCLAPAGALPGRWPVPPGRPAGGRGHGWGSGTRAGVGDTVRVRGSPPARRQAAPVPAPRAEAEAMAEERDVRFVTEESFDFGFLSPSDSQEEEEDEESPAGAGARGGSGRWSPLSGARLEEMVREATRLAAQLEQCHLPPPIPSGTPSAHRSPRSPRRETFVVKDSPVRALLPTVEPRGPPPATTRAPTKARGAPAATNVPGTRKVSPSCHPTAVPKGPPGARVPPPSRVGPPRPCPPQGQGAGTRGKSEPLQAGTAGQPKVRGGAAPCPPAARLPRARATAVPVPSGRPLVPSAIPRAPGRTPVGAPAPRGAGAARAAPRAAGSGCKPGPPPSRLRPPRKTAVSSTPR
ncbi:proline/serine-rich coiled-coil protein 1 [Buteo buteo]|uniref:proline/serine-rich coiled-coil protein 1 n=1 Tax=Buteo buteo TaxID=30397 RepID=UPI003EB71951